MQHALKTRSYRVSVEGGDAPFISAGGTPSKAKDIAIEYWDHGTFFTVSVSIDAVWTGEGRESFVFDFRETMRTETVAKEAPPWLLSLVLLHRPEWYTRPIKDIDGTPSA